MAEKQTYPLIPIKGISKALHAALRGLYIYDIPTLLQKGKTQRQRNNIASKLNIDVKYVNSWVKQAELWRVDGMNPDMAYLLVQIGVRHTKDLSKIDADKAYLIMERLVLAQPDFQLTTKKGLSELISNAESLLDNTVDLSAYRTSLIGQIESKLKDSLKVETSYKVDGSSLNKAILNDSLTDKNSVAKIEDNIRGIINTIKPVFIGKLPSNAYSLEIETDEEEPTYLFREDLDESSEIEDIISKYNGTEIYEALRSFNDICPALPLPHTVRGTVYEIIKNKKIAFPDALVEISGAISPSKDKSAKEENPSSYTDCNGNFIVVMPDKYSLKETIKITISQGANKQVFIKSASDFINSVPEQAQLEKFLRLEAYAEKLRELRNDKIKFIEYINKHKEESDNENILQAVESIKKIDKKIGLVIKNNKDGYSEKESDYTVSKEYGLENSYNTLKAEIIGIDNYASLEDALSQFLDDIKQTEALLDGSNHTKMDDNKESSYEGFIIIKNIFEGNRKESDKALPSVKLMDSDDTEIRLSTDTAPSRIFSFKMLQRLVEPTLSIPSTGVKKARKTLSSPLNVMDFKDKLCSDPNSYPQMSTLGIGYVLNMHQAWVPDGFSLGSLLYSLVLAPGEEQRLVVRENKQSYEITDEAEGSDETSEEYSLSQDDDASAAFNYALDQLSTANSSMNYSSKTSSFGASLSGGFGGICGGLSGGYSKTSGNASSSAKQANSQDEASSTSQNFQHSIKSASAKISQAKRISVSAATSEVSDSVSTRIIANHNHSHAMTIQYWEVMRRYKMESCVDGIDLVLFVPMQLIRFIPQGLNSVLRQDEIINFNKEKLNNRYKVLLRYASSLQNRFPLKKYRTGLSLMQQYSACPKWKMEDINNEINTITISFKARLLFCDDLSATLILKNGKGRIAGVLGSYKRYQMPRTIETRDEYKTVIRRFRNGENNGEKNSIDLRDNDVVTFTFSLPTDINPDDLSYIQLTHKCDSVSYELYKNDGANSDYFNKSNGELYDSWLGKYLDSIKDNDKTSYDKGKMSLFESLLPEAYFSPHLTMSGTAVKNLGVPTIISEITLSGLSGIIAMPQSTDLNSSVRINLNTEIKTLRYSDLQKMEELLQHVSSEVLFYSQVVWSALSSDERAMMLDHYTINMNFNQLNEAVALEENDEINDEVNIPLLNCVDVKKLLGFYGNCMLLPFTYPQSLAEKLGKTAGEIQDALYRYHTNSFRVPTTTITLPTNGMIGEAVLGETNVSEVIDLTRFWNWKDSPIDSMEVDSSYLNSTDYLEGKTTKDISALNLSSATAATPVTVPDLVSALTSKQTPTFDNLTGLAQLQEVLNKATESSSSGCQNAVSQSASLTTSAVNAATEMNKCEIQAETTKAAAAQTHELEMQKAANQLEIGKILAEKGINVYATQAQTAKQATTDPKQTTTQDPKDTTTQAPKVAQSGK